MRGGCIKNSRTRGRDKAPRALQRQAMQISVHGARIMHTVNYFRTIEQRTRAEKEREENETERKRAAKRMRRERLSLIG